MYNTKEKRRREDSRSFLLLDISKIAFQMRNLTHRWIKSNAFAQKLGHFFDVQKRAGETDPLIPR